MKEDEERIIHEESVEVTDGLDEVKERIIEVEEVVVAKVKEAITDIPEQFKRIDAYKVSSYFLVCAFIGWVWETAAVWVITGELTDRGFLFIMDPLSTYFPSLPGWLGSLYLVWGLPIIMIYGVGGAAICSLFKRWRCHPLQLFIVGSLTLTAFELLASYLCDWILGRQYWDYSAYYFNFQGRICLSAALTWGFLCLVGVRLFAPRVDRLYMREKNRRAFKVIIVVLMAYAAVCAVTKYFIAPDIIPY